jgi:Na+(H+)/acetate symporter ActP
MRQLDGDDILRAAVQRASKKGKQQQQQQQQQTTLMTSKHGKTKLAAIKVCLCLLTGFMRYCSITIR